MSDMANTIDWVITFGKMWRLTMRRSEKPAALAARTYSCSFATSISPRTMRAYDTHPTNAIAMYMLRVPAPSTKTRAITSTKNGNATKTSTIRMITVSSQPPR